MIDSERKTVLAGVAAVAALILGLGFCLRGRLPEQIAPGETPAASRPAVRPPALEAASTGADRPRTPLELRRPLGEGHSKSTSPDVSLAPTPDILAAQNRAMDTSLPERDRLHAVAKLRHYGRVGQSPEVLDSMAHLIASSSDEQIRGELCRLLRGGNTPEFCQQLMATARTDVSARVRFEAVRSLAPLAADPLVKQTLEAALKSEQAGVVKAQLEVALSARH